MKSKPMICLKAGSKKCITHECDHFFKHVKNEDCADYCQALGKNVSCILCYPKREPKMVKVKRYAYVSYGQLSVWQYKGPAPVPCFPCHIVLKKSDYDKLRGK